MRKKSLVSESHPKALVCLNGAPLEKSFLVSRVASVDYVVAVDGGLNGLIESGITPDIVIGDLDSAKPEYIKKVRSLHMPDQYSTDLEKAFEHLKKIQITNVDVVGIEAGRVDHFLSNFFLLWKYVSDFSIQVRGVDWIGIFGRKK
ncbi:MAG: thiamine diphosphokinase [Bdellovibrionota bacterium]